MKTKANTLSTPSIGRFIIVAFFAFIALSAQIAHAAKTISVTGNLSFGSVAVGSSSQLTMVISNSGNNTLQISGITYPTGFSGAWSGSLLGGRATNITVTFTPTTVASYSGTVTVNSDATGGNNTLTASGTGTGASIALIGNLAFGSVAAGSSAQATLTITNTGTAAFTVSSISYPAGFSGSFSGTIASHSSADVVVTFSPTSVGSYSGTVTVNSTALAGVNTISTSGLGTGGVIALGGNLSFGGVIVGSSSQQTLVISNVGNATLTVSGISLPAGFSGSFSGTIDAGSSTNVTITFSPTDSILYSGSVSVSSDAFSGTSTIGISGDGIAQTRIISLSGDLTFGNVPVGSSSQQTLTITNSGNSTLTISNITVPIGFAVDWTNATVAPGTTTNVTVTFSPLAVISYGGTITVESDATGGNNTVTANASGVGLGALIALGGDLSFGNVIVGASAQQTLTISNTGNATLTVTNISLPTGFSGSFSGDIAAGDSTNVTITFTPTDTIVYGGLVTVNSDAINGVNTILAAGTGIAQTRIVAVGDLNFGNVAVGSSNQLTLSITNLGNWPLTITNVTYPNGFTGDFTNGVILAGAFTNITVTFTPTAVSNYVGTILFGSDLTGGSTGANASGVGTGAIILVGGDLNFGDVTVGSSAQQTLIISNIGNSTLTVSGITFPSPEFSGSFSGTIEGGASTNVTVTFTPSAAVVYDPANVTVTSDAIAGINTIAASGVGVDEAFNYTAAKAKFNGLFFPTNDVEFTNSGYININVNKKGHFSAHLRLAGKQYPFTGTIAADGSASATITRNGQELTILLQVGDNGDLITGTVSNGSWTADISADRATFSRKNPTPLAGVYSFSVAGGGDAEVAPATNGTGTITISTTGHVTINETLGDGTHVTQNTMLSKDGQIPFFGSLYGGNGSILGWLTVSGGTVDGNIGWFKLPISGSSSYPSGFTLDTSASGLLQ